MSRLAVQRRLPTSHVIRCAEACKIEPTQGCDEPIADFGPCPGECMLVERWAAPRQSQAMISVGRHVKRMVRESLVLRSFQDASRTWVARRPLADVPGWLGRLHDIKVP